MKSMLIVALTALAMLTGLERTDAQWVQTSGPEGGQITAFASHNGFVFAGTSGAGNFRSSNGGTTWTQMNSGYGYPSPTSYLVKGTKLFSATVNVYWTTDNGSAWTPGTGLPDGNSVTCLATDGTNIYGGISAGFSTLGVFRSADDGATWQGSNAGLPDFSGIASLCVSGTTVFAGTSGSGLGIYRSTDQGMTWALSGTGSSGLYVGPLLTSGSTLIAGTSNTGIYRSTDNGDSWQSSNTGLPAGVSVYALHETGGNVYAATVTYSPTIIGVYMSTNNGASWTNVTNNLTPGGGIFSLGSEGTTLFAGVYGKGVQRSTDNGTTWTQNNSELINSRVTDFASTGTSLFAVVENDGAYRSLDNGANWTLKNNGISSDYFIFSGIVRDGSNLVVAASNTQFQVNTYRSTDEGTNWTAGTTMPPWFFLPAQIIAKDGRLFAATYSSGVFMSTNYGDSWAAANNGIPFTSIDAIAVHNNDLFAAGNEVYRSTDDGANWTLANTGIPSFAGINKLASTGSSLYATRAYSSSVYRTTDMGTSWTAVTPLPGPGGTDLISSGTNLLAGVINAGVYLSSNGGTSWTNVRDGLPTVGIVFYSLAIQGSDLFCGTDIAGVWRRPLSEITSVETIDSGIPEKFALDQNYPNPFNPMTAIRFSLPSQGRAGQPASGLAGVRSVALKVYDLLGREIATLVNETLAPGSYTTRFDGSGLSSGVYFYTLEVTDISNSSSQHFSEIKSLLLLK